MLQIGNDAGPITLTVTGGITYTYPGTTHTVHDSRNLNIIQVTSVGTLVLGGDLDNRGGQINVANNGVIHFTGANVSSGKLTIGATTSLVSGRFASHVNAGGTVLATGAGLTTTLSDVGITDNGGVLGATGGAILDLACIVKGSGQLIADGGTILLDNATMSPTSGEALTFSATNGGTIETAAGTNGSLLKNGTAIAALTAVTVVSGSSLTLQGKINNAGEIVIQDPALSGGSLLIHVNATLDGGGSVVLGGSAAKILDDGTAASLTVLGNTITGDGNIGNGDGKLTVVVGLASSMIAVGGTIVVDAALTNRGLLLAQTGGTLELDGPVSLLSGALDADGGLLHVVGALTNSGYLSAEHGGTLVLDQLVAANGGPITADGGTIIAATPNDIDGRIKIGGGGEFELLSGTASAAVKFTDTAGTLLLGAGNDFTGTVAGLRNSMGNAIDLAAVSFADVSPATESYTQGVDSGVLTIGDGIHANSVTLLGQFAANFTEGTPAHHFSGFVLNNDGSGGTLVSFIANAPGPVVS
jgi:fibronectin-binding autotransporter adhesin